MPSTISTGHLTSILEGSGLFKVSVSSTPPIDALPKLWDGWRPVFSDYDAIIINYNSGVVGDYSENPWPSEVETAFEDYLSGGGGVVITHSTFHAFGTWENFITIAGLAWRERNLWPGLYIDSSGSTSIIPVNEGRDPHSLVGTTLIVTFNTRHPITQGMPGAWMHAKELLDLGFRGPAENLTVLNYTYSIISEQNEPIDWTVQYGNGRVYANSLGHVMINDTAMLCIGYQTMIIRGTEWAATGAVTYPIPENFPTDSAVSLSEIQ